MKKVFFILHIVFVTAFSTYNFSMENPEKTISISNKMFLQNIQNKYGPNKKTILENLQKLATGLLVQERLMEVIPNFTENNQNLIEKRKVIFSFLNKKTKLISSKTEKKTGNYFNFEFTPETPDGLKVELQFRKFLITDDHKKSEIEPIINLLLNKPKNSEPYFYGLFFKARLEEDKAFQKYNDSLKELNLRYDNINAEHGKQFLNIESNDFNNNFMNEKLKYIIIIFNITTINYEKINDEYQAEKQNLNELYKQLIESIQKTVKSYKPPIAKKKKKSKQKKRNKKSKNPYNSYLKTLEKYSTLYPQSLDNQNSDEQWLEGLTVPKPKPKQQKLKKKLPPKHAINQKPKKISDSETSNNVQTSIPQQQKEKKIVYASDGSYTDPEQTTENEIVIVFPETGATYHLYALDNSKFSVKIDLLNLPNKQNIKDWKKDPQEALEIQGYTQCGHKNYNQSQKHTEIITIHTLPEEIKKYYKTHAQQTTTKSRIRSENDTQITFCGEIHYQDGSTKKTGLYIYLIDPITNEIFHQLFTDENCTKLANTFREHGNFTNVFFPSLNWAYGDESNV